MVIENLIKYLVFAVSTGLTYFLGKKSKEHKWNETLPIPVQNCIVGIAVFILTCVFCLVMKKEINPEFIFEQIISAMFGVGTATVGYDIKKSYNEK